MSKEKKRKAVVPPLKERYRDIYFIVPQKAQQVGRSALHVTLP